jgi:5-methylthioadenosine/S-adenosylhomocysteine deaminase
MDPARQVLTDGALVYEGGRIVWLGPARELPQLYRHAPSTSLSGRVILPGFVNLHTHAALVILRGIGDDLGVAPAYSPKVPQGVFLSPEDVYCFSLLGGLEALRFGTTCIVDNYIYADQVAQALAELGLRAVVSERLHDADLFLVPEGRYEFETARGAALLARNLDLIAKWEGAAGGRIHTRLGPHAPDTCSPAYLEQIRQAGEQAHVGYVTHLAQSRREVAQIAARAGQSPAAHLETLGLLGPQMIAGHCIYIEEDDKQRLAQTQTQVVHLSGSNAKGGMMAPIRDLRDGGVNIGLGTDNMAGDMIEVMRLAVCIARMRGEDNQALWALDALEMATLGGARALGMEAEIGSLEVGKRADLVVIDFRQPHLMPVFDPVANLIHNGLGSDVEQVYVDGELLVENGRFRQIEAGPVMAEAQARATTLWAALGGLPTRSV